MKVCTLPSAYLMKLRHYFVGGDITNQESELFYFDLLDNESLLFKYLGDLDEVILANKIFTLEMLEKYADEGQLDEFVLSKYLVNVDGKIRGFLLPEQKNVTPLGILLKGNELSKKEKLELVRSVGGIVQKGHALQVDGLHFFFSDLHENNFLVHNDNRKLSVVDLDGATFRPDIPLPSYYLIKNSNLGHISKYSFNVFGIPYPSRDNDLLCYNMMLLNVIAEENVNLVSIEEYSHYLDYLQEIGFSEDLVDSFRRVYSEDVNENASLFLGDISEELLERASFASMKTIERKK